MTTKIALPHRLCPIGNGAEHDAHAFHAGSDLGTVTCEGWVDPEDDEK